MRVPGYVPPCTTRSRCHQLEYAWFDHIDLFFFFSEVNISTFDQMTQWFSEIHDATSPDVSEENLVFRNEIPWENATPKIREF